MKHWFALSAIGRDRPGIVADLAELIYECDCNLEDSSMTILGSEFAVLLLLTGEERGRRAAAVGGVQAARVGEAADGLLPPARGRAGSLRARATTRGATTLQAVGVDKAGIVAKVARCLADHRVNITQMSTQSRPEPETGHADLHHAHRHDVPRGSTISAARSELEAIAARLHIELTLQPIQRLRTDRRRFAIAPALVL